ncbi:MAG: threonine synthase [Pirellulales bacterium]
MQTASPQPAARSFVTHLESAIDGTRFEPGKPHTTHAGRPLWVRYDLPAVRQAVTREEVEARGPSIWRWRELLPAVRPASVVTLGEGITPLLRCDRLGHRLGLDNLFIKDDSQLPTGSFKSRGQALAITMAKEFGITRVAVPTAGNAGGAMAAYAARAGIEAYVFMPADTPAINQFEAALAGAHCFLVDGLINDCGAIVRAGVEKVGWFDVSTLKEPYRIEGKKTMGLELAQQFDWTLPDVILYPTGGGTGLIGMWKAFQELRELGWLRDERMPRMVSVQSTGCAPIVTAFDKGDRFAELFPNAATIASGLRVPVAVGDFMILDAVRASGGTAIAIDDDRILEWMHVAVASEGVAVCPESAACVGAADVLRRRGWITADERVVIFNCGAAQKYPHVVPPALPRIESIDRVDWESIVVR